MKRTLASFALISVLAACAQIPTATTSPNTTWQQSHNVPQFDATGRMGIQTPESGHQANFAWTRTAQIQQIDIRLPIGGSIGKFCADPHGAQLTTYNGQVHRANTITELSQNLLGYNLPIAHLDHWLNGQIVPNEAHSITPEGYLKQMGWTIQRQTDENNHPRLLILQRPDMTLRIAINQFGAPENPPTSCNE